MANGWPTSTSGWPITPSNCAPASRRRTADETPFVYPLLVVGLPRCGIICLRSSVSMSFVLAAGPLTRAGGLRALHIDASSLRQGWQLSRKAGVWSGRPRAGSHGVIAVRGVQGLVVAHPAVQAVS